MALLGYIYTETVSAYVDSSETDFEVLVDLSIIPSTQWALIRSDGGNLRLADSTGTEYPAWIEAIDTVAKTGLMKGLMPSISSPSNTEVRINVYDTATTAPAVSDSLGRNNVSTAIMNLPMNEASGTLVDITGNGHDATHSGTFGAVGVIGDAIECDGGATEHAIVSHDAALNSNGGAMTWNIWFNSDDAISSSSIVRSLWTKGTTEVERLNLRGGTYNGINVRMVLSGVSYDVTPSSDYSGTVGDGDWHMATVTRTVSDVVKIFLDGDEIASNTSAPTINSSKDLYIGKKEDTTAQNFDGRLDQYAQYNFEWTSGRVKTTFNNVDQGASFFTNTAWVPATTYKPRFIGAII